jgi:hypothetical protein
VIKEKSQKDKTIIKAKKATVVEAVVAPVKPAKAPRKTKTTA